MWGPTRAGVASAFVALLLAGGCGAGPPGGWPAESPPDGAAAPADATATDGEPTLPGVFDPCGAPARPEADGVTTVLEVAHAAAIASISRTGDRLLSRDETGRWVLWNPDDGTQVASGEHGGSESVLRGGLFVISDVTCAEGWDVRAASDGRVLFSLGGGLVGLALDGSYVWRRDDWEPRTTAYAPDGSVLLDEEWPSLLGEILATTAGIQAVVGPTPHVEVLGLDGSLQVGAPFAGTFRGWSQDGSRFFTSAPDGLRVYDLPDEQVHWAPVDGFLLGGEGALFATGSWTAESSLSITIYRIGTADPLWVLSPGAGWDLGTIAAGFIVLLHSATSQVVGIPLDPSLADRRWQSTLPLGAGGPWAVSAEGWAAGNADGALYLVGAGTGTTPSRPLGCGKVLDVAGAPAGVAAVAVGGARTFVFELGDGPPRLMTDLPEGARALDLADDGAVLATSDRSGVAAFRLPTGELIHRWPMAGSEQLIGFDLAADGHTMVQTVRTDSGVEHAVVDVNGPERWRVATPGAGSPWGDPPLPGLLSADGQWLAAVSPLGTGVTNIHLDGVLDRQLDGTAVDWLGGTQTLCNRYRYWWGVYDGAQLYNPVAGTLTPTPVPEMQRFDQAGAGRIYSRTDGRLYDPTTGAVVWSRDALPPGRAAGTHVLAVLGRRLVAVRLP